MATSIFFVDAFTDRAFRGNPAAVCLCAEARDADWMQLVANEMNLSETAFVMSRGNGEFDLRWFTPRTEVDLCGHATLATAHVLWHELGDSNLQLRFHTRSGLLSAQRFAADIGLDFPAADAQRIALPTGLEEALGCEVSETLQAAQTWVAVLADAAQLTALQPDAALIAALPARALAVTAASDKRDSDFVSRFFAPRMGIDEDPVTGSAHCLLAPYWAKRLGKTRMNAFQASPRGGSVQVRLAERRVELRGRAITTLRGELDV